MKNLHEKQAGNNAFIQPNLLHFFSTFFFASAIAAAAFNHLLKLFVW